MRRILPWASILVGLACLLVAVVLAARVTTAQVSYSAPTILGCAVAGLMLLVVGLVSRRSKDTRTQVDSRHAYPLFALVGLVVGGAMLTRHAFVPDSFGLHGHFRGTAPQDARRPLPRHQGDSRCAECHAKVLEVHAKDAHLRVACEACHGPTREHVENPERRPRVDRSQKACLTCHQRLDARPPAFPQIEVAEHYRLVGVADHTLACTQCHSPHEPLFMDRDLREARLHPLVHRCRDCHAGRADDAVPMPKTHPAIFDCQYCHQARVADFATRKHKSLRCSTCHIFRKETPFAGRIVRDSDPRFCLLCHQKAPFRSASAAPGIEPEKHLKDMGAEPKASCLECHKDSIHADLPKPTSAPADLPSEAQPASGDGAPSSPHADPKEQGSRPAADARPAAPPQPEGAREGVAP